MSPVARLVLLAARRDRVLVPAWTLVLVGVVYASAAATGSLYPQVADRVAAARAIDASPAVVALYGPVLDVTSAGELAMTKTTVLYAVLVALLLLLVVRRHTRAEEESGRAELLGGTVVGRRALLTSAVAYAVALSLVIGLLASAACVAGGLPVTGSVLFGASWTGVGLVATGISAVACQLSASARTCAAVAGGAVGGLFLLRAVGDVSAGWLSWLSPFGWSTRLRAWSDPRWWVLLLDVASAVVLVAVARVLGDRRDLGAGLVAARPGPVSGSRHLAGPVSLTVRLHATSLAAWTAATAVLGVVLGAVTPGIGSLLGSPAARAAVQRLGGAGALEDSLVVAETSVVGVVVTCFAVGVLAHAGVEERSGRTELVLVGVAPRTAVLRAALGVAVAGGTWLLLVAGLGASAGYVIAGGSGSAPRLLGAALAQAPALWVVAALAGAAYAVGSRWAAGGWVLLAGFVTVGQVGELLHLPSWVVGLSPYAHVPRVPVEALDPAAAADADLRGGPGGRGGAAALPLP